jgi:hypothetical protein
VRWRAKSDPRFKSIYVYDLTFPRTVDGDVRLRGSRALGVRLLLAFSLVGRQRMAVTGSPSLARILGSPITDRAVAYDVRSGEVEKAR